MDFFQSFGITPPEQVGPTVHTPEPAPAPMFQEAPPVPPVTVKKRCDDKALRDYAPVLAAEFRDGCTAEDVIIASSFTGILKGIPLFQRNSD